jgi:hypothetical protein
MGKRLKFMFLRVEMYSTGTGNHLYRRKTKAVPVGNKAKYFTFHWDTVPVPKQLFDCGTGTDITCSDKICYRVIDTMISERITFFSECKYEYRYLVIFRIYDLSNPSSGPISDTGRYGTGNSTTSSKLLQITVLLLFKSTLFGSRLNIFLKRSQGQHCLQNKKN